MYVLLGHVTAAAAAPEPEQVLTVVQVSETKVALKSAFGRYMSVASSGELSGRAEAIGPRETWELVFEEVGGASPLPSLLLLLLPGSCCAVCLQPPVCDADVRGASAGCQ